MNPDGSSVTIPSLFAATVQRGGAAPALGFIRDGELSWRTWAEVASEVRRLAAAIVDAGIQPGDRIAHVSENRYEWIIADLAIHLAHCVHVPIHVTLHADQIADQIRDCGARLVFISTTELLAKLAGKLAPEVPLVVYESDPVPSNAGTATGQPQLAGAPPVAIALGDFVSRVDESQGKLIEQAAVNETRPDELATILYTSGTTGRPRGVMLSQRNIAGNAVAACQMIEIDSRETRLCFLPLSHIYARTCDLYTWLHVGSRLALAENRDTVIRDCGTVQPLSINAVPYFYQKIHDRIRAAAPDDAPSALRQILGGNIERCFGGGAALAPDVEHWFIEQGLPILVGYGLTESSPVISVSTRNVYRPGSVGRSLNGVDIRVTGDGEILVRGPNVMRGYWQDEEATCDVIRDGWLHTGDLGELDDEGFLFIRGRKKEIIVLSTGKNVAPTCIEGRLAASPLIEQVAVVGDGRSHLGALIVPCIDELRAEIHRRQMFDWPGLHALHHPDIRAVYAEEIARRLACAAREEQVHSFILLERAFSIERGELTPKLSLRRSTICENFRDQIDTMYAGGNAGS